MAQAAILMGEQDEEKCDHDSLRSIPPGKVIPVHASQNVIEDALAAIGGARRLGDNIVRWERLPAQPAQFAEIPVRLAPDLVAVLRAQGFEKLYSHQAAA